MRELDRDGDTQAEAYATRRWAYVSAHGELPWLWRETLDYYVEQADAFGPEWVTGFNVAPVVENVLAGLFSKD